MQPIVIDNLKKLQEKLQEVSPAIEHIRNASKAAEVTIKALDTIPKFISELQSAEIIHRKNLNAELVSSTTDIRQSFKKISLELNQLIHSIENDANSKSLKISSLIDSLSKNELISNINRIEEFVTANNSILDLVQHQLLTHSKNTELELKRVLEETNEFKTATYDSIADIIIQQRKNIQLTEFTLSLKDDVAMLNKTLLEQKKYISTYFEKVDKNQIELFKKLENKTILIFITCIVTMIISLISLFKH